MAIASHSAPPFSASFCCCHRTLRPPLRRLAVSVRLNSSSPSSGSFSPDNGDLQYELQHGVSLAHRRRKESSVFVTMPLDALSLSSGQIRRRKAMAQSFKALAAIGIEGVVMEVWWGLVESDSPGVYNWRGYVEIVSLARRCGLKVRAVMAFHQCGSGPGDPSWIPLPQWVLKEMDKDPDLAFSDRFGRRSTEYISLGCDTLPVLHGRSPIQAYSDFMRNFRDTFRPFLGGIITGIQVGMGPDGELRYPSCPPQKLSVARHSRELGEFQCYDKYMRASLNACAREVGMQEWENRGPIDASNLLHDPENTEFFSSNGSWNTPYGEFFLEWYSGMLLLHGERICSEADTIFRGIGVNKSAKVAAIHWHFGTESHPSELTAGYYNTSFRDGYLPIARIFGRYGFTLCCKSFDLQDRHEQKTNPASSPEGFLRQILVAARICDIPLEGENSAANLDGEAFQQVVKMSKLWSDGIEAPPFSFTLVRMSKNMFDYRNWVNLTRFVREMSVANSFRAELLGFGGFDHTGVCGRSAAAAEAGGALVLAYY